MRKITEVLRLKFAASLSHEKIARAVGLSNGVVNKYVSLAEAQGLSWPLPEGLDEAALEGLRAVASHAPVAPQRSGSEPTARCPRQRPRTTAFRGASDVRRTRAGIVLVEQRLLSRDPKQVVVDPVADVGDLLDQIPLGGVGQWQAEHLLQRFEAPDGGSGRAGPDDRARPPTSP